MLSAMKTHGRVTMELREFLPSELHKVSRQLLSPGRFITGQNSLSYQFYRKFGFHKQPILFARNPGACQEGNPDTSVLQPIA